MALKALALVSLLAAGPAAAVLLRGDAAPANATATLAMSKELLEGMSVTPHN
eukprot:CAMPEP_0183429142 /NCGR_PEP_ID=MMETSP0370-20130417/48001_1 /TAXON_ID=268820 /ORGANISM="Peridinium aciculiferum, Strain PAER-2" /LENGTH=51 /DNA_ID=CAMNT_0025614101 /DNA_START=56 /DNA_END=208 /DNA_ORIENTATION=+